jgi:hypothetical protein
MNPTRCRIHQKTAATCIVLFVLSINAQCVFFETCARTSGISNQIIFAWLAIRLNKSQCYPENQLKSEALLYFRRGGNSSLPPGLNHFNTCHS